MEIYLPNLRVTAWAIFTSNRIPPPFTGITHYVIECLLVISGTENPKPQGFSIRLGKLIIRLLSTGARRIVRIDAELNFRNLALFVILPGAPQTYVRNQVIAYTFEVISKVTVISVTVVNTDIDTVWGQVRPLGPFNVLGYFLDKYLMVLNLAVEGRTFGA